MVEALERLASIGLIQPTARGYVLHRLIGRLARESSKLGEISQTVVESESAAMLRALKEADVKLPEDWLPHLGFVAGLALIRGDFEAGKFLEAYGVMLTSSPSPREALGLLEAALRIYQTKEPKGGDGDVDSKASRQAQVLTDLGELFARLGDLERAQEHYLRAMKIQLNTANIGAYAESQNKFGLLLKKQGNLEEAEGYYRRSLQQREQIYGSADLRVAESWNNLGALYRDWDNKLKEARDCYERALKIRSSTLERQHPQIAQSLLNLGAVQLLDNDLAQARRNIERALEIRKNALGHDHPETAMASFWMGRLLRAEGDTSGARLLFKDAWTTFEATLGPNHKETERAKQNYEKAVESLLL